MNGTKKTKSTSSNEKRPLKNHKYAAAKKAVPTSENGNNYFAIQNQQQKRTIFLFLFVPKHYPDSVCCCHLFIRFYVVDSCNFIRFILTFIDLCIPIYTYLHFLPFIMDRSQLSAFSAFVREWKRGGRVWEKLTGQVYKHNLVGIP